MSRAEHPAQRGRRRLHVVQDTMSVEEWWMAERAQARRDVEDEFARNPPQPQNNVSRPVDGRPFIISARNRRQMVTDMKIWAWIHLVLFLLGITAVVASAFRL